MAEKKPCYYNGEPIRTDTKKIRKFTKAGADREAERITKRTGTPHETVSLSTGSYCIIRAA